MTTSVKTQVRCGKCGARAVCLRLDEDEVEYECTSSVCKHSWTEERDPECERCNETLSEHVSVTSEFGKDLLCPGVLEDNTFSPVTD
jgi:hypothetical protein